MSNKEIKQAKMYKGLYDEFARIAHVRFINRLDKRASPPTVQKKMLNHPLWEKLRKDLEVARFIDDKRGQAETSVFNLFNIIIISFIALVLFGGLIWVMGLLNNTFQDVGLTNEANAGQPGYVNMTQAANNTFGQVNNSIQALRLVAITLIFSEILSFILISAFIKRHPALFFVYVFIVVLAVMFAAPVSNSYETLLASDIYGGLLLSFTGGNWFMLNMPLVIAATGMIGAVFMFINIIRVEGRGID